MATKSVSVRLSAAEQAALALYPGRTVAQKIRAAILRGGVADELAARVSTAVAACVDDALRERLGEVMESLRDAERGLRDEIWAAAGMREIAPAPLSPTRAPAQEEDNPTQAAIRALREKGVIK